MPRGRTLGARMPEKKLQGSGCLQSSPLSLVQRPTHVNINMLSDLIAKYQYHLSPNNTVYISAWLQVRAFILIMLDPELIMIPQQHNSK